MRKKACLIQEISWSIYVCELSWKQNITERKVHEIMYLSFHDLHHVFILFILYHNKRTQLMSVAFVFWTFVGRRKLLEIRRLSSKIISKVGGICKFPLYIWNVISEHSCCLENHQICNWKLISKYWQWSSTHLFL